MVPPHGRVDIFVEVGTEPAAPPSRARFRAASARARHGVRSLRRRGAAVGTSGRVFNEWLGKSRADLALLTTELATGPYPYAGIPWFSTAFGRDAIITALQVLWLDPTLAQGVLRFLAEHQATETSRFADAAPGKIMHETRKGEMARLRELPFGRYYGGVDTTPLFVMLAGLRRPHRRSGPDRGLVAVAPGGHGLDRGRRRSNRDGFLDYARGAATGLANQGWKDSADSVFHADDGEAVGPIALVEAQGYVHAAFRAMADLARRRGAPEEGDRWAAKAEDCGRRWRAGSGSRSSAPTRSPWTAPAGRAGARLEPGPSPVLGAARPGPRRAGRPSSWVRPSARVGGSGRSPGASRYNPMSYHNGSVWPHDTALCAAGMARYGAATAWRGS